MVDIITHSHLKHSFVMFLVSKYVTSKALIFTIAEFGWIMEKSRSNEA